MKSLLTSPGLIDLILIFTVIEAVVLILWRRRAPAISRRKRPAIGGGMAGSAAVGLMLLPGVCLMLAVRAALAGASWPWVPTALTAALVTHLLDLRSRWRS